MNPLKPPYRHQAIGIEAIVKLIDPPNGRIHPGCVALFDEMGAGKTRQVIDAAVRLWLDKKLGTVIIVCPAAVRSEWWDKELGQIANYARDVPLWVLWCHRHSRSWSSPGNTIYEGRTPLSFIICNYEFLAVSARRGRKKIYPNAESLLGNCGEKTMLVLDESSMVKSSKANRTRACNMLRKECGRVVLLNGTPIAHSPADIYAQAALLDPRILRMETFFQYRATYAITARMKSEGGKQWDEVVGWRHKHRPGCCEKPPFAFVHGEGPCLEDIQAKLAPYVLRRLRKDCLDLPGKLAPVILTATLAPETWRIYCEMRAEFLAWLGENAVAAEAQAGVRAMRLSQVTSGFIGGLQSTEGDALDPDTREVGREKLELLMSWIEERLEEDPNFKLSCWCRFRPEVERTLLEIQHRWPFIEVAALWGTQSREERERALKLLNPQSAPSGPVVVVGTQRTGALGINQAASHTAVYCSNDTSLLARMQSEDRLDRPPQTEPVSYFDIMAVGPRGQKTIDHTIIAALQQRRNLADWTCSAWESAVRGEVEG